jgi:hypothetical protein
MRTQEINDLKKSLELRQENLVFLLKNKREQLELEKQHQIYGAIKEIDYILRMMNYADEEKEEMVLSKDEHKATEVRKVGERIRSFKVPIRFKFKPDEP